VKKGDTTFSIAKNYGITSKQLMAFNHLKNSKLHRGQSLVITQAAGANVNNNQVAIKTAAGKSSKVAAKTTAVSKTAVASKTTKTRYVVKRGETLASIARKFNVGANDLQRWNKINHNRITAGHALTIYRPDDA
jgi:membrane-bound lytic murein transglycosylase D